MKEHSADGTKMAQSRPSELPLGNDDTTLSHILMPSRSDKRKVVIYARVSSRAQQSDLNRQVAALSNLYPEAEVVSEIRGGLNFKGKKMLALLGHHLSGDVRMVVVAHQDRLAIWGFDLFRWLCEQNRCSLMVLNETSLSREPEMVEDILAILHCFSSRLYGRSQYKTQVKEDPDLPQPRAKSSLAQMAGCLSVLLQPSNCIIPEW